MIMVSISEKKEFVPGDNSFFKESKSTLLKGSIIQNAQRSKEYLRIDLDSFKFR